MHKAACSAHDLSFQQGLPRCTVLPMQKPSLHVPGAGPVYHFICLIKSVISNGLLLRAPLRPTARILKWLGAPDKRVSGLPGAMAPFQNPHAVLQQWTISETFLDCDRYDSGAEMLDVECYRSGDTYAICESIDPILPR